MLESLPEHTDACLNLAHVYIEQVWCGVVWCDVMMALLGVVWCDGVQESSSRGIALYEKCLTKKFTGPRYVLW